MLNMKKNIKFICRTLFMFLIIGILMYFNTNSESLSIKTINALDSYTDKKYVYPLGNVVGIRASTEGVLVIGYEEDDIEYIGGLKIGDIINKINDTNIDNSRDISNIINKLKDDEIKVGFTRNNEYKEENIKVKYENNTYRLGLWVRDKISGIGTMTFYDPSNDTFLQ